MKTSIKKEQIAQLLSSFPPEKAIDFDQAVQMLGLTSFDEFVLLSNAPEGRGTGRTTRMLIEAVVYSQYQPVTIKAHSQHYANDLIREAKLMAMKLGLDPDRIGKEGVVFWDHYVRHTHG